MDKIKQVARWAYDWATVLVVGVTGTLSVGFEVLDMAGIEDVSPLLTPVMEPETAAMVMTWTALAKASLAYAEHRKRRRREGR